MSTEPKFSFMASVAGSDALQKFRKSQYSALSQDPDRIPKVLDNVLTEFGMTAVFRGDRGDIIAGIELELRDEDYHPHAFLMGGGCRVPSGRGARVGRSISTTNCVHLGANA